MSGRQAKANRQIGKAAMDELRPILDARLDRIEDYVRGQLEASEKRNKGVQSWLINEVKTRIQNDLFNANVTLDAVVEVLAEAGLNIPDFAKRIDSKKLEIAARMKQEAEAKLQAEREAREAATPAPTT